MFCYAVDGTEASDEDWDLDVWAATHKDGFIELSRRYMACFGRMTTQEAEPIWEASRKQLMEEGRL